MPDALQVRSVAWSGQSGCVARGRSPVLSAVEKGEALEEVQVLRRHVALGILETHAFSSCPADCCGAGDKTLVGAWERAGLEALPRAIA